MEAEWFFFRLLPLPDDHGCAELTPLVVKGRVFPLRNEITIENIEKWITELVKNNILNVWEEGGRLYGEFKTWSKHQRIRSLHQRKTPDPPSFDDNCQQSPESDRLIPIPIPIPISKPSPKPPDDAGKKTAQEKTSIPFKEIIDYLNEKAATSFKNTTKATQGHIAARWNEGFRLDDFFSVIDKKCAQWKNDQKYCEYLRPQTLFGTKFESYLNGKAPKAETISKHGLPPAKSDMDRYREQQEAIARAIE